MQPGPENRANIKESRWQSESTCPKCGAWRGELGQEPTPQLYIEHLVEVFREVRRTLRDDGVLWINIGDSYANIAGGYDTTGSRGTSAKVSANTQAATVSHKGRRCPEGLKIGDLVGIPWTLAFALQQDGWYLRRDVIWAKVNCMPESVHGTRWEKHRIKTKQGDWPSRYGGSAGVPDLEQRDGTEWTPCLGCKKCDPNEGLILRRGSGRPTTSHEYIFMFTKTDEYFYDSDAISETVTGNSHPRGNGVNPKAAQNNEGSKQNESWSAAVSGVVGTRNKRSVWTIVSQPYTEDHFAAFPEELPEICIKASTSERGVCAECGAPWVRIVQTETETETEQVYGTRDRLAFPGRNGEGIQKRAAETPSTKSTLGWRATCGCNAGEPIPATVLDTFLGRGTTGTVAVRLGRNFIGCDLQPNYVTMARKNINNEAPLFVKETV